MATYAEILVKVRARLDEVLTSPMPSYTENGKSWDWNGYTKMLLSQAKSLELLVQMEQGPLELTTQAVTVTAVALTVDMTTWHRVFCNTRAGTLTSVSLLGNTEVELTTGASRSTVTKRELETSNGIYRGDDVAWELPNEYLSGIRPKPRDTWTDENGTEYRILHAEEQVEGTIWRLICRDIVLAEELHDVGDYYRWVYAQDDAGARVPAFSLFRADMPCRIQPITGEQKNLEGVRMSSVNYEIYLDADFTPVVDDLFRVGNQQYEIIGWHAPERIDELLVLEAVIDNGQAVATI